MKKTLITLLALAGVVSAVEPITLGSWFTHKTTGAQTITVDAVQGLTKSEADAIMTDADGLGKMTFKFNVNVSELMYSTPLASDDVIQVTKITLASNAVYDTKTVGKLSITLGGNTYVSDTGVEVRSSGFGTTTYTFTGDNSFTLGTSDVFSVETIDMTDQFIGVFKGQSGVSTFTAGDYTAWQPAVKIEGVLVPEPATATLSLLALAGLAMRRRRK